MSVAAALLVPAVAVFPADAPGAEEPDAGPLHCVGTALRVVLGGVVTTLAQAPSASGRAKGRVHDHRRSPFGGGDGGRMGWVWGGVMGEW